MSDQKPPQSPPIVKPNGNGTPNSPTFETFTNPNTGQVQVVPKGKIWLRKPDESEEGYEAFQMWLKMKLEDTKYSVADVAQVLMKSRAIIWKWHKRHEWESRLIAYQNNEALMLEAEQRKLARADASVWYERKKKIRDRGFQLGEKLLDRAESLLMLPVHDTVIEESITVDGKEYPTKTVLNFQQHPRDARLFLETGIKLMRMSAEMPTDYVNLIPADVDLDNMQLEDLLALANKLEEGRKAMIESENQNATDLAS